jgi:pimeloyl-ACP methyl ester carboxylesterase
LTGRAQNAHATDNRQVTYNTLKIDDLEIFYREAGEPSKPTFLLLHGFPTSSHMFRNLIPLLTENYHVVAPDYPGFGYSSAPKVIPGDPCIESNGRYPLSEGELKVRQERIDALLPSSNLTAKFRFLGSHRG